MLFLTRRRHETILIDGGRAADGITIHVNRISGNRVTIGVEAPDGVKVLRGELKRCDEGTEGTEGQGAIIVNAAHPAEGS